MPPYWLLVDIHDFAKVAAFTFAAGCGWVWLIGREFARHRSTVETSASGDSAPSGAGVWVVESEREVPPAGSPRDGQHLAVVTGPSTTPPT